MSFECLISEAKLSLSLLGLLHNVESYGLIHLIRGTGHILQFIGQANAKAQTIIINLLAHLHIFLGFGPVILLHDLLVPVSYFLVLAFPFVCLAFMLFYLFLQDLDLAPQFGILFFFEFELLCVLFLFLLHF